MSEQPIVAWLTKEEEALILEKWERPFFEGFKKRKTPLMRYETRYPNGGCSGLQKKVRLVFERLKDNTFWEVLVESETGWNYDPCKVSIIGRVYPVEKLVTFYER